MSAPTQFTYDVFVSYSHADEQWVRDELWPKLEGAGLKVSDNREFELGVPKIVNIERAIEASRKVLLILTPDWIASEWTNFESLLIQTDDLSNRIHRTLPLLLKPCEMPKRLSILTHAVFTQPAKRDTEIKRLLRALGARARIFISYKRDVKPDETLALDLKSALTQAGHHIFIDQTMLLGVEWALEIERQIKKSDFLLVLLSEASAQSEMVAKEVESAYKLQQQTGKPIIVPVRVNYPGPLPYQLSHYLDKLQQAQWQNDSNTSNLIQQLLDTIGELAPLPKLDAQPSRVFQETTRPTPPRPVADLRFIETLRDPFGTVRLRSEFYIEREDDERFYRELRKPYGTTTTIRAPRQSGKSSLLIRGVMQAQERGSKIVSLDLQPIEKSYLQSLDMFLQYFAAVIATQLGLDPLEIERAWHGPLGATDKATHLMEDYILPRANANIVLAIDEADRLLGATFQDSFFGLLRFWNNNRAKSDLWDKLSLVLVISTEPHLLIKDVAQSPFNVGVRIQLEDFSQAQVAELNRRYRSPLEEQEVPALAEFLGGHPYLTRKALYTLMTDQLKWEQMRQIAASAKSPFGDHLRHFLWILRDQPELRDALKQIILHSQCSDEVAFYRLEQAGLVKGADSKSCRCRCQLYEHYFKEML